MYNFRIISVAALLILLVAATAAQGQIVYGQPASVTPRIIYTHWSGDGLDETSTINQFIFSANGMLPLKDNFEMRYYLGSARNSYDYTDSNYVLSGLSDIRLQANHSFAEDHLLLSAGLNLPTGKKELSSDEQNVMRVLLVNYLSFPIRRLGEGFGLNLMGGVATNTGDTRFGGTVMYQVNGSYTAYDGGGDYKPGNMFAIGGGLEAQGEKATVSLNMMLSVFAKDKQDDSVVFKSGTQFDVGAGVTVPKDKMTFNGSASMSIRGKNEYYTGNASSLVLNNIRLYGNEFRFNGNVAIKSSEKLTLTPTVGMRIIAENDYGYGSASIFHLGGDVARSIGQDVNLNAGFRYYTGSANSGDISLTGFQFSVALQAAFK